MGQARGAHHVQPFSKRPPYQPRPVFHRQEAIGHASYTPNGYSYPPPAPSSLAPVAMGQYAERSHPTNRGVANTVHTRAERPTWRTGAMILLAGVFVGGTFGVGVQARRNAMDARADVAAAAVAPAQPAQPAQPVQAVQAVQPAMQATAPGPTALQPAPQAPPQAYAHAPAAAGLPPGAIVIPPQPGVTVVPARPVAAAPAPVAAAPAPVAQQPKKAAAPAWRAPSRPAAPHGGIIAAKVTPPKPEKAAPPPPAEKAEKAAPKKGTSEAEKILKDAIGETTNTL
jgi:hypothetical protein